MIKRVLLLVAIVASCVVPGLASQARPAGPDEILLKFEISKNGQVIAQPSIRVAKSGTTATLPLANTGTTFTVTPTRIDGNTVRLAMDVTVGAEGLEIKASVVPLR